MTITWQSIEQHDFLAKHQRPLREKKNTLRLFFSFFFFSDLPGQGLGWRWGWQMEVQIPYHTTSLNFVFSLDLLLWLKLNNLDLMSCPIESEDRGSKNTLNIYVVRSITQIFCMKSLFNLWSASGDIRKGYFQYVTVPIFLNFFLINLLVLV